MMDEAHMHEVARANALAHDLAITRANLESLRSSIIAACSGTKCLNAHELRQRLDRAEAERNVLRAEVKAARMLGDSSPIAFEFRRQQWADARRDTDAAKAMEEKR
jgi:hypothetical protein